MKIVFLAPFGIRPKGTVIARMLPLAKELQRLGEEVVIIAPPYTNPEDSGRVEMLDGVLLRNVRLGPRQRALAAPVLAWRLFRCALKEKPDLIHLFKPKGYGGLAAMAIITLRRAGFRLPPVLLDTDDWEGSGGMNEIHGYSSMEQAVYAFQEKWLTRHSAAVTVASRGLEEMSRALGGQQERMLYLPNCVREQRAGDGEAVRARLGIDRETPLVLLYTRFFEFEQERLASVFAEIHRRLPAVRFLVVGRGRHGEEEQLLVAGREAGFAEELVMAGWVEPGDLPDYLAAGDVAIYPFSDTLVNRCKCPAKLTELLLAGCPVVGDRVGQVAEYIEAGRSGILCDPDAWQGMADQVVALLNDPSRRKDLGLAGRQWLLKQFNWRQYAERLAKFYRTVLSGTAER